MEYKAVYKCRLCGQVFYGLTTTEELAEAHMVEITAGLYGTVPFTVRKTETHRCGDGPMGPPVTIGLADFLGWSEGLPVIDQAAPETPERTALYETTQKRMFRAGIKTHRNQIIFLAKEIEGYRSKIRSMEAYIDLLTTKQTQEEAEP